MNDSDTLSAQAYLAAVVQSTDDAVITKSPDGTIQSCNPAVERVFGYAPEELIGESVFALIPPERHAEEKAILARVARGERVAHYETVRVRKDGRRIDVSLTISPVYAPSGKVIGASKIARDITDRKRFARELAAQREWFRVTLASIGDAVIATDATGRISYMNGVAEGLTGWRSADAEGLLLTDVFRIVDELTGQPAADPVELVMRSGEIVRLKNHTVLIDRHRRERPIADSAAPIRDAEGIVIGAVLVFRDISEQRRAESERQAAMLERERLLEAERAARAEAERASRVKDEFIAMVSHELRTPLNAILGWTQLIAQSGSLPNVVRRGVDVISRNTRVQAQLISDLLDMSRIISGKLRLSIEQVELAPLIRQAIETVQQAADNKRITIVDDLEELAPIAGDPARLQQIVWNLLWNAIKFTPEGGEVRVRLRELGSDAEITVTDSGVGIRPELLPHIFDRFQQGDVAITRRFGGLGLGLAIVKHLVELHGGSIGAYSEGEGKGATFTVVLPSAGAADAAASTTGADSQHEPAHPRDLLDGLMILVVEDEPDTLEFLRRFLESHGASVVAARSAAEALERLPESGASFLISDIGLPGVDGYELLARIRAATGAVGGMPAIALTAYARREDRMLAFRAGYQAHLAKPVEPNELVAAIASLARLARGSDARQR